MIPSGPHDLDCRCARCQGRRVRLTIAQNDDLELFEWICIARERGGSFVSSIAQAALVADWQNYPLMRPLLLELRKKYPEYECGASIAARLGRR